MESDLSDTPLAGSKEHSGHLSEQDQEKRKAIQEACGRRDFATLVELATSTGGLLTDELRRQAWPILLGCDVGDDGRERKEANRSWRELPRHADEDQVRLDVDRAFVYYPKDESEQSLEIKKRQLSDLIVSTLRKHPVLSYFQSYHDVVQVLLLVLGDEHAAAAVPRISLLRLRDYMLPTISPARKHFELVSAIVKAADPELAAHIAEAENSFALSATHSLFAHDIQDYGDIARLYDFLLAHEPVMSIYLFAAVTISRRAELLEMPADQSDILTFMISKLPQTLNIDALALDTLALFRQQPPEKLEGFIWWRLSQYSVLKTSRQINSPHSLEEAELLCKKQIAQLRRDERMKRTAAALLRHQRPILSLSAALLVGALSLWLRKSGQDRFFWTLISSASHLFSKGQ
ncbi:GTPase-activating protein gyp8 [Exophiala dermatitidis]|uniref:Rab-GAP TBC domain-containing protein n=2 Tax=Exophiala dermatitidis TaxID=5970 RepID=H6C351_EXODN